LSNLVEREKATRVPPHLQLGLAVASVAKMLQWLGLADHRGRLGLSGVFRRRPVV
jgi:hypothetical protein